MLVPVLKEDINGVRVNYRSCPVWFIPESIHKFLLLHDYYKSFPSAPMPTIKNVSYRFVRASRYLDAQTNEFSSEKRKGK